jgi:hypothetical protein
MEAKTIGEMTTEEFFAKFAKLVFCKDAGCAWNEAIPEGHHISFNRDHKPIGEEDLYYGVCSRGEVGLTPRDVSSVSRHNVVTTCDTKSDIHLKGHVDFTKMMPAGGL